MLEIAHRASGTKYKLNTKDAIINCLKLPYIDGVEFDVRMSRDKVFVISHNQYIFCNGIKKIEDITYDELKSCKEVSLLKDVLSSIKSDKYIFLDLKIDKINIIYEKKLIKILKKHKLNYYLIGFSNSFMRHLKHKYKFKVGLLKGYIFNINESKGELDGIFSHYLVYNCDEGIWTINDKNLIKKFLDKDVFVITDKPIVK